MDLSYLIFNLSPNLGHLIYSFFCWMLGDCMSTVQIFAHIECIPRKWDCWVKDVNMLWTCYRWKISVYVPTNTAVQRCPVLHYSKWCTLWTFLELNLSLHSRLFLTNNSWKWNWRVSEGRFQGFYCIRPNCVPERRGGTCSQHWGCGDVCLDPGWCHIL